MAENFEILHEWARIRYKKSLVEALNRYERKVESKKKPFLLLGNDSEKILEQS